jgi:hypothetical protein
MRDLADLVAAGEPLRSPQPHLLAPPLLAGDVPAPNQNALEPILTIIGARKLRDLTAADVRQALAAMAAGYSTAAVSMGHLALKRAIRHAEASATLHRSPSAQNGGDYGDAWVRDYARREGVQPDEFLPTPLRLRREIEQLTEVVGAVR